MRVILCSEPTTYETHTRTRTQIEKKETEECDHFKFAATIRISPLGFVFVTARNENLNK